jgi:hypothetical protein
MVIADGECLWTIAAAEEKVGLRKPDTLKVIDLARFPHPILFYQGQPNLDRLFRRYRYYPP